MLASVVLNAVLASAALMSARHAAPETAPVTAPTVTAAPAALVTPVFRRYVVADGLPSGTIYAVTQDRRGLMWFAAASGLVRYDGVSFTVFRHAVGDPQSMPAGPAYTLFVDRDNCVWVGGIQSGLIVYDQRTDKFHQWLHDDRQPASLASNEVWSIAQTPDGQLWVATEKGLQRMRPDGSGFAQVPLDAGAEHAPSFGPTRALLAEPNGRLWIAAERGLFVRQPDGTLHRVPVDPAFRGKLAKAWHIDASAGEVRVAVEGGLLVIGADGVAHPLANGQLSSLRILSSARDRRGRLWIGSADGVWLQNGAGPLQLIVGQPLLPGGLPGNKTWQTMLDREGGLWITFDESSIAYLPPRWDGFARFTHVPDDPASLSNIVASSVLMSRDGGLWVGGENGWVDKLDLATGRVQHVVKGVHGQVVALAEDNRDRLWIAVPGGLQLFDQGKLSSIDLSHTRLGRPVLLAVEPGGRIDVASWGEDGGVFAIDPRTLAITRLALPAHAQQIALPDQLVVGMGSLWDASAGGLMRWNDQQQAMIFVPGVPRIEITALAFDASGFWASSEQRLEHYRYANGLAVRDQRIDISSMAFASDLTSLRVDRNNRLWLFANPGLWRLDAATGRFIAYGAAQGLSNAEFSSAATEMAPDGTIVAPTTAGVIAFRPDRLLQSRPGDTPLAPALSLTYLSVRRDDVLQPVALNRGAIRLGWRDRDLSVRARVASFIQPALNHYRFQLQGFDTGWVDVDSRGERDFAGLAAGDYTLYVRAAGADGVWATLAAPLKIHVQSPPWMRWWAWLCYLLLLLCLLSVGLLGWRRRLAQRHRMQLIEQQRQLAEAASAAKTQFLATLSHEIRTPMTGVMGMAELLLGTPLSPLQHDYTRAMQRSGGMLLKLLNDALDLARIEAGRLELESAPFDPRQLVEDVAQLEQGLAHFKGIQVLLDIADDLPGQVIGDAVRIKQVLLNLANNALKFTEHGSVTVRARRTQDGLMFSVSDTGPGIPEASQARLFQRFEQEEGPQRRAGSGLGLAICRELVDAMGGSVEIESRVAHGSTFRVRLPLTEPPLRAPRAARDDDARVLRLLLVEDDTIVAAVIGGLLEQQGHSVCHVINGLAALAELAHAHFDGVLLDLDLPGVDGFQIARLIRQRAHAGEHMPIVAVTARAGAQDEARARAAGMDGFLRKPLSGEQLAEALGQWVVEPVRAAAESASNVTA
jgi:signal transduction histidine kinase/CheY-like chemotaxis protein